MSSRRDFLTTAGLGTAAFAGTSLHAQWRDSIVSKPGEATAKNQLPRWRGFVVPVGSLAEAARSGEGASLEDDFRMIRDFGFDFIRPTVDYWDWVDYSEKAPKGGPLAKDLLKIKESGLAPIDNVIDLGRKYGLHVSLCMHRAPGYNFRESMLGQTNEPFNLWNDKEAQDAFAFYWDMLAKRYRGVNATQLSFDLVHEPQRYGASYLTHVSYFNLIARTTETIRTNRSDRMVLAEGLNKIGPADESCPELTTLLVGHSLHGYAPLELTHYRDWLDVGNDFSPPEWPVKNRRSPGFFGRADLEALYAPWGALVSQGAPVHCGELGCINTVPHDVTLRFLADQLEVLRHLGIGWAIAGFRGTRSFMDSNRRDVAYEDFHGHKLDRKMLTLLQYV